jgi:L-alanine-DL-glutamate epimerase-like enolase superfamily enzyme
MEPLCIPFRVRFKHASAERSTTETVLVRCESHSGKVGFGEGCPRSYVTGETIASCQRFFSEHREALVAIHDLEDLRGWTQSHRAEVDANPAAWCALESALLEALARENQVSVEGLLGLPELAGSFAYTAVLGDSDLGGFAGTMARYVTAGFRDFKVKVGGDAAEDRGKLEMLIAAVPGARIRLDANNLWTTPDDVLAYLHEVAHPVEAIEEPLRAGDYEGLGVIARTAGLRVILDESFLGMRHFDALRGLEGMVVLNLRVSKMGGLLRSLEIARSAMERQIPLVIGAQVGETSLLTRAALTVANTFREGVIAQEGAFGTALLERDIVPLPLMFGSGGQLDPSGGHLNPALKGFGLDYQADLLPF